MRTALLPPQEAKAALRRGSAEPANPALSLLKVGTITSGAFADTRVTPTDTAGVHRGLSLWAFRFLAARQGTRPTGGWPLPARCGNRQAREIGELGPVCRRQRRRGRGKCYWQRGARWRAACWLGAQAGLATDTPPLRRGISLIAMSDEGLCPSTPPPFEKVWTRPAALAWKL